METTLTIGTNFKGHPCNLLQVVLRARRNLAKEDFFGDATTECHAHAVRQLFSRVEVALLWQILSVA